MHIKPALGAVKLSMLTAPQIQSFYNELGRTGKRIVKKDKKTGKKRFLLNRLRQRASGTYTGF